MDFDDGDIRVDVHLDVEIERWPLDEPFTIARGAKTEAVVVVVRLDDGVHAGRGEAVPYPRYGETPEAVAHAVRSDRSPIGAAKNALELARIELEARRAGLSVVEHLGLPPPEPLSTLYTIPLRDPDETRRIARREASRPLLKLKLGGGRDDLERVRAAREGSPSARFVVDANEGWDFGTLESLAPRLAELGVELIEQPLPAASDHVLRDYEGPIPLCADESFRGGPELLESLADRYGAVNLKLDKIGGLVDALVALERAHALGLKVMVGTMVSTSLAVAPAVLLAQTAEWADLDAPLYLSRDRRPGLRFEGSLVHPPRAELWG